LINLYPVEFKIIGKATFSQLFFKKGIYNKMLIQKRNGNIVEFNKEKIVSAINKAFIEVDGMLYETDTANDIADEIKERISNKT
jgi:hypothetical protein